MIQVFDDKPAVAKAAAQLFLETAVKAVAKNGRFLVALSGGSTPAALFSLLKEQPYINQIPWSKTHVFWSDERLVPPDEDGSNFKQANDLFLRFTAVPPNQIYRAKGEMPSETAVADYKSQLQTITRMGESLPIFDLILLGMGNDGHTASLFPGPISKEEENEPIIAVTADYDGRPAHRLTFTPHLINKARLILLLVTGDSKATTVNHVINGETNQEKWPVQRIQPSNGQIFWYLDQAAARHLSHNAKE